MIQGIIILAFLLVMMLLIIAKKIPTAIALIIASVGVCIIAGIPFMAKDADGNEIGFLKNVVVSGSTKLASNIMVALFGAWLGQVMNATGITKTMIKKGAELGGDKTIVVQIILLIVSSVLFTTITGLGGTIMVGTIVLPILISVGVDKVSAAVTLLLAKGIGATMSSASNKTFSSIVGVEFETVYNYGLLLGAIFFVGALVLVIYRHKKFGKKFAFSAPAAAAQEEDSAFVVKGVLGALALLTPVIPIILIAVLKVEVIPSMLVGIVWAVLTTCLKAGWDRTMNMLTKALYEGIHNYAPALSLMIAIGILMNDVNHADVSSALSPFMQAIIPGKPVAIVIFFAVLAPLCLYRGPFNLFGMGAGIASLVVSLGLMSPIAAMVGFVSVAAMQQSSCPTNTQNVWTADFVGVDVTKITTAMLPIVWATIAVMVTVGAFIHL